ncbi:MAG: hypothetical protein K2Q06_13710, partial [Parvularculaceae bacterium]|nr:hypothetical protein [Parvularculaceae bacterium]
MKSFLASLIASIVGFSARFAILVALVLTLATAATTHYVAGHFRMNTETDSLLADTLPFRQDQAAFERAFNRAQPRMIAVIDGATPEIAEEAAAALAAAMEKRTDLFALVRRPDGGAFFRTHGLLYLSVDEVRSTTDELLRAQPFLGPVAEDPSLHGLAGALSFALDGVAKGNRPLADLDRLIVGLNEGLGPVAAGEDGYFSWRSMIAGKPPEAR